MEILNKDQVKLLCPDNIRTAKPEGLAVLSNFSNILPGEGLRIYFDEWPYKTTPGCILKNLLNVRGQKKVQSYCKKLHDSYLLIKLDGI